ncbi:MAG: YqaA family protein [Roseinatronobacter sp.]
MLSLTGLFLSAFVAATLLPAQSETVLLVLLHSGTHPVWLLVTVASIGNVLGSVVNWAMGRYLMHHAGHPRFPFTPAQIARAQAWYARRGWVSLFGSWLPVIGDPLTLVAGVLHEPLWRFLLVVSAAKTGRYVVLVLAADALLGA